MNNATSRWVRSGYLALFAVTVAARITKRLWEDRMPRKTVELIMSDKWVLTKVLESQPTTDNGSVRGRFMRAVAHGGRI